MSKIHILHGEQAVREYEESGATGVRKAYKRKKNPIEWSVSWVDLTEETTPRDIAQQVIESCDGYQESVIITEREFNIINGTKN